MLSLRTITKVAHAAGLEPPGFAGAHKVASGSMSEEQSEPYTATEQDPRQKAIDALIGNNNAAAPWVLKSPALELIGYLPGDVLIVDLNRLPVARDIVCAQHYHWSEARADTIFRVFEPPYLITATHQHDLRRPLLVDNERVIIKGVVIFSLRTSP